MESLRTGTVKYALALALAWIALAAFYVRGTGVDWRLYLDAGHNVGNVALLTTSHFVYTPGAAWALWPFAHLPLVAGYFLYVAMMVAAGLAAAWFASKMYGMPAVTTALMVFAWAPFTIAVCLGQNAPIALLLMTLAIYAIVKKNDVIAGVAAGLLLYKPSDAVPMAFLLLILRQWRSLGIVGVSAVVWYALSAAATADWLWPAPYMHMASAWYRTDVVANADYAISVPTMLARLGLPTAVGWSVGAAILLASVPFLRRVSRLEAASIVPLLGLAASPHAWGYEAVLALPALWFLAARPEPLRIALVAVAYAIAPFYLLSRPLHFDALAIPVLGGAALWFATKIRALTNQEAPGWSSVLSSEMSQSVKR